MASTEENTLSGEAQSRVLLATRLRCCGMTSRAVHTRHPKNIAELKQFCKEEWSKIPPDSCAGLIHNYRKCLTLLLPKEGQPVIKSKVSHTFPTLHCERLHGVFNKDMKTNNCLCVISLSRLCLSIVVT